MKKTIFFLISYLVLSSCNNQSKEPADTIYINGKIYTVDKAKPWAEAVAIKGGKFINVGSTADVEAYIGDKTEVIDLEGQFMMPGVFDLHAHPFITPWYGSMNLSLKNSASEEGILSELKTYAEAHPDKEWIIGGQWLLGVFPDDNPHKKQMLVFKGTRFFSIFYKLAKQVIF